MKKKTVIIHGTLHETLPLCVPVAMRCSYLCVLLLPTASFFFDRNTQEIVGAQKRKHKRAMWNQLCGNMFNNKRAYVTWWALWRELPTLVIHFSVKRWKNPVSNSIGFVQGSSFTPKGNSIYRYLPFFPRNSRLDAANFRPVQIFSWRHLAQHFSEGNLSDVFFFPNAQFHVGNGIFAALWSDPKISVSRDQGRLPIRPICK